MAKPITEFNQIIGHRNLVRFLQNVLKKRTLRDVSIFYGSSGLGKTSLAKLVAVELVAKDDEVLKKRLIDEVIINSKSNEMIKLIGMTDVADKDDEIAKVKSELSLGFSTTGVKVLIIDEVQGMTKKAQDGLLTELEHLQNGVYVIMCTNDRTKLQDALWSRCRSKFQLHNLNRMEIGQLVRSQIEYKNIKFTMNLETVITLISYYSNFQARDAVNLIDNFEDNSVVTADDLSVFVNANETMVVIQLVNYLYGSLTLGIDYISTMEIDDVFQDSLSEVLKVAMGGKSKLLTPAEEGKLFGILKDKDINILLHFVVDVLSYNRLTNKHIMAAFIKNNRSLVQKPERVDLQQTMASDLTTIEYAAESSEAPVRLSEEEESASAETLEEILARAAAINEGY